MNSFIAIQLFLYGIFLYGIFLYGIFLARNPQKCVDKCTGVCYNITIKRKWGDNDGKQAYSEKCLCKGVSYVVSLRKDSVIAVYNSR